VEPTRSLKIVSWNVHGWRDSGQKLARLRILKFLQDQNPEVLALQEVKHPFPASDFQDEELESEHERVISVLFEDVKHCVNISRKWSEEELQTSFCKQLGLSTDSVFKMYRKTRGTEMSPEISFTDLLAIPDNTKYLEKYQLTLFSGERESRTTPDFLSQIKETLGMQEPIFQHALDETFGNALLSKLPLSGKAQGVLASPDGRCEKRSFIFATINLETHNVGICTTHLDDRQETWRQFQLNDLLNHTRNIPHLLVGDFNALKRDDYDDEELEKIQFSRSLNKLEPAKFDLIDSLTKKQEYQTPVPFSPTCNYRTRIDYIWQSKDFPLSGKGDTINNTFSDHSAVMVDYYRK